MSGASRVFGLGILVSARDDGATRTIDNVTDSTEELGEATRDAGRETADLGGKWNTFMQGLQLHRLNEISGSLQGMAQQAGAALGGMGDGAAMQATSIESHGVAVANTFRTMTAGMGDHAALLEGVRGEISSLSYSLDNVSPDQLLQVNAAIARSGNTLDEYGISQRAVAGLLNAGIIDASFGQQLDDLSEGYGLGATRAGAMMDRMIQLGEATGDSHAVMGGLTGVLQQLDAMGAEFPEVAANVDEYAMSTMRLAATMQQAGLGPMQDMIAQATAVTTSLAGSRQNLTGLFTGVNSDFDHLAQELAISTGDTGAALDMVMNKPFEFAQALNRMSAGGADSAAEASRLRSELVRISPELAFLADGGEEAAQVFEVMATTATEADGSLERVGRGAARTSRTLSESMGRQQDSFETRLNRMSRRAVGGAGSILNQQRQAHEQILGRLGRAADKDGPLGSLARGFLRSRAGLFGFTSALDALGGPVLDMAANLAPVVSTLMMMGGPAASGLATLNGALGGMPGKILGILGPIGLLAGAGYLIWKNWSKLSEIGGEVGDFIADLGTKAAALAPRITAWVAGIEWAEMGRDIVNGILTVFTGASAGVAGSSSEAQEVAQDFATFFKSAFDATVTIVGGLASGLWDGIVAYVTEPPDLSSQLERGASVLGAAMGVGLFTPMRGLILGGAKRAFKGLFSRLAGFLGGSGGAGGLMTGAGMRTAARRIPIIGGILGVLFELPTIIDQLGSEDYSGAIKSLVTSIADGMLMGIPSLLESLFGVDILGEAYDFFAQLLSPLDPVLSEVGSFFGDAFDEIWEAGSEVFDEVSGTLSGFVENAGPLLDVFKGMFTRVFGSMKALFTRVMGVVMSVARVVFSGIGTVWMFIWNNILKPPMEAFKDLWVGTLNFIRDNFADVFTAVGMMFITVMESVSTAVDVLVIRWDSMAETIKLGSKVIGSSITAFFLSPFMEARNKVSSFIEMFQTGFMGMNVMILQLKASFLDFVASALSRVPGMSSVAESLTNAANLSRAQVTVQRRRITDIRTQGREERALNAALAADATREAVDDMINLGRHALGTQARVETREALGEAYIESGHQEMIDAREASQNQASAAVEADAVLEMPEAPVLPGDAAGLPVAAAVVSEEESAEASPAARRVSARTAASRRRERQQEARESERRQEREEMTVSAINAFGPTAVQQLAAALTIEIPRGAMLATAPTD